MTIREWPRAERPREKLIERGPDVLSDAELLAVLIGSGLKGRSAVEIARTLIANFGSLRELLSADQTRWLKPPGGRRGHARCLEAGAAASTGKCAGIGPARYAAMQAALELTRRHLCAPLRTGSALHAPEVTRKFLIAQLRDRPYEVFCCLFLDLRHRLIAFEELFRGTINGASVHPREVVRQTLFHNATAVILAHNHPSGCLEPSQPDEFITLRLRDALALVDVRVLDHLIVGDGRCFSFAEHGLL